MKTTTTKATETTMQYRAWWYANGTKTFGAWRDTYEQANDDMWDEAPAGYRHRGVQNSEQAADPDATAKALSKVADNM